jgi:hypothetical protein
MAFDHNGGGVFDSIVTMLQDRLGDDAGWREPLPVTLGDDGRRMPAAVATVLRNRIAALQAQLVALETNEAELTRAWRATLRSGTRR